MRIAHNLVIDYFRRENRIPTVENTDAYDIFQFISNHEVNVEHALIQEQITQDLQKLIHELPEDQKEVLIMRLYRDMSFKEIAENTQVSINTAFFWGLWKTRLRSFQNDWRTSAFPANGWRI